MAHDQSITNQNQDEETAMPLVKDVHQQFNTATLADVVSNKKNTNIRKKPSRPKSSTLSAQNVTLEKRMSILLNILNSDKVREVDYTLVDDFSKEDAVGQEEHHTVDRRTLTKIAQRLEKEGKARIITVRIPLLNGMAVNKNLLLHGSVDPSDDVVSKFIENIREQNALFGRTRPTNLSSEAESVGVAGDGSTKVTDQESQSDSSQVTDVMALRERVEEQKTNSNAHWRLTAKYYGWIPAIMLRLRVLHRHMMRMAIQEWSQRVYPEDISPCKIAIGKIITKMPLKTFLTVIGVHKRIPMLDTFLLTERSSEIAIEDLPAALRSLLFDGHYRYRKYLRVSLETLNSLKLIKFVESKGRNPPTHCELLTVVPLCDYREEGHPVVRHMKMTTLSNQTEFWKELQFLNTGTTYDTYRSKNGPQSRVASQNRSNQSHVPMDLSSIASVSSWFMKFDLDSHARQVLEQHVDRENKKTPLQDHRLCLQIANECNISVQKVRDYFRSIESMNKSSERKRKKKAAKAQGSDARSVTVRRLLETATADSGVVYRPHVMTTGIQGWAHNRGKAKRYSEAVEKVFEGEGRSIC